MRRISVAVHRRFVGDEAGSSMVEFAVVLPLLLVLLVGIVDFGRYMYAGIELGNAARAGVQYGARSALTAVDTAGMESAARSDARDISLSNVAASYLCSCHGSPGAAVPCDGLPDPCLPAADYRELHVTVIAQGAFAPLISYPGFQGIAISRTSTQLVSP
jgi:Flp pilus assembly pilin Flp